MVIRFTRYVQTAIPRTLTGAAFHSASSSVLIAALSTATLEFIFRLSGKLIQLDQGSYGSASSRVFIPTHTNHAQMEISHLLVCRSSLLDTWTWDQLRTMKVGGNAALHEFFSKSPQGASKDAKTKYTSKVAVSYKEKLEQRKAEDAIRYDLFAEECKEECESGFC